MFHIHNGDSTANTLREFGFPGDHVAFQEVLMAGPTPASLSGDEWLDVRAKFLSKEYDLKLDDCKSDLLKQEATLQRFSEYDEIILWFEHDLFCQINLIYLLDWFSKQSLEKTRLSLICIGEFSGVKDFRGLAALIQWLCFSVIAFISVEVCEIVKRGSDIRVVRPKYFFPDYQGTLKKWLCLSIIAFI